MRVLHLGWPLRLIKPELDAFSKQHEIHTVTAEGKTRDQVIQEIESIVIEHGPFEVCLSYGFHGLAPLGEDLFASTLPHLKMITNSGAGTDILDVDWFSKHGIYVANTPTAVTKATADGTAMMILSTIKNTTEVVAQAKSQGHWREGLELMGDPEDMTLGIIGMGKIGEQVAQRMSAFGMKVVYHNRTRLSESQEKKLDVVYASMDELLEVSDVISVMCPLTPSTRHILNKETLDKAKDGVIVVNTSRGGCVDTEALIECLKTGKVSRCAIDVFETEPEIPQFFKDSNKVMVMPHYLAFTRGTLRRIELELLENMITFGTHGKPKNTVNKL